MFPARPLAVPIPGFLPSAESAGDFADWVNPYATKSLAYPGRIFHFHQAADDIEVCRVRASSGSALFLEFGSGSGGHLLELAARNPTAQLFGFEIRFKRAVRTIEKADRLCLPNVAILRTFAENAGTVFSPGTVDGIWVNFPDPWAKLRQRKHRLLGRENLLRAVALLKEGGILRIKTDHQEYFTEVLEAVGEISALTLECATRDLHGARSDAQNPNRHPVSVTRMLEENIQTEFESLFRSQSKPICALFARRMSRL